MSKSTWSDSDEKHAALTGTAASTPSSVSVQHNSDHRDGALDVNEKTVAGTARRSEDDESYSVEDPELGAGLGFVQRFIIPPTPPTMEDAGPPPDGGWTAWTTCVCTHLVFANTWGFINSFGVFQAYYADFLAPLPPSTISWIGSVQVFFAFFLSGITGRLSDAGYFHQCYWFGFVCVIAGLFGSSCSTQYWQLMLSQGFAVGIGGGFMCCPSMSIVTTYFTKKRMLALGVLTCGNVTGGLVYPALARQLLPSIGFAWTMRTAGFLQLALLGIAGLLIRPRVRAKPGSLQESMFDWNALREPDYVLFGLGMIFNIGGTFISYYYIASFGRSGLAAGMTYPESLNLLLVLNGVGVIGRLSSAYFADHVGPINILCPVAYSCALFCFSWIAIKDQVGLYVWISLYGIVAGALQALFPAGLTSLTTDMSKIGQRIGLGFTFIGAAVIFGPPAAGAMVTALDGSYIGTQAYAGSLLVVGASLVVASKFVHMRRAGTDVRAKI
ncbi:major facilitator superfamily transporter [Ophiostoma piceae UAMH 11346]|uniref:Major facilitator superfamily transporter n=1 Tax=Ophiostoma piceae (strain UAMH 11346) TaxID=1262450 RepID=S3CAZ9_OPHP1|nr:major facilitator superfamily transporter [Ophiostoma piceae UAMH 11346]